METASTTTTEKPILPDVLSLRFAHQDLHPEMGRRATMCEASVALATERSAMLGKRLRFLEKKYKTTRHEDGTRP